MPPPTDAQLFKAQLDALVPTNNDDDVPIEEDPVYLENLAEIKR
jgi:hypothetical protein